MQGNTGARGAPGKASGATMAKVSGHGRMFQAEVLCAESLAERLSQE